MYCTHCTANMIAPGPCPDSLFLGGCAWGVAYYIGMYRALFARWGDAVFSLKIGTNSGGCLIGVGILLRKSPEYLEAMYADLARLGQRYGTMGKMSIYHHQVLEAMLGGDEAAYRRLNGRLFVGLTQFPGRFVLRSEWNSNKELMDCIHASMHIPWLCTHIEPIGGKWYIDGGFSKIATKLTPTTITVSPIATSVDVHPATLLSKARHFVAVRNFDGEKGVAKVLHHLCLGGRHPLDGVVFDAAFGVARVNKSANGFLEALVAGRAEEAEHPQFVVDEVLLKVLLRQELWHEVDIEPGRRAGGDGRANDNEPWVVVGAQLGHHGFDDVQMHRPVLVSTGRTVILTRVQGRRHQGRGGGI